HVRVTRRDLLLWGGGALAAASLTGCSFLSTDPSGKGGGPAAAKKGKEAPSLAKLVKSGELPKVAERLPKNPLVVQPVEEVGAYGGKIQTVLLNATDTPWLGRIVGHEPLARWNVDATKVEPNVAESIEPSSDAMEYTITLREGMKWSDGEPFTADDLVFAFDEVILNEELTPVIPEVLTSDGKPAKLEKIDDVTVKIVFPAPNGLFYKKLGNQAQLIAWPKHYMEQFHKKFNPDVEALAEQEDMAAWTDLFFAKADVWANPDVPRLHAWKVLNPLGKGTRVTLERNPYYWKTDPDGSQLPYIDEVVYDLNTDAQVILLKATNGELSMSTRHINTLPNKPVLAKGRTEGDYRFLRLENTVINDMVISLNLTHKDPVKRKIFQNKDFRIGLSHAINRPEMITATWQRQGEPFQAAPDPRSEFYDEEFGKQYTEYDVALANESLDKAGLTEKDGDGFRLRPDGKRLFIQIEVASPALVPFWVDGATQVAQFWKAVGVDTAVKNEDRSLFYERKDANEADCTVWTGDGGLKCEMIECRWWFPFTNESNYAPMWQLYFNSRGADGEKPPPETLKQMELYWEMVQTPDEAGQKDLFRQILQIAKEQFYAIGTVRIPESYGIAKNNLHNIPEIFPESHIWACPANTNPEQWYFS
ncbi:ABC transporter substrate-binding protein, partial [Actinopolymorpha sp. B11F2]|uniref:ABC transporter substrate-binding protein n=1 Tax=Actinopolymorpha sp. B11F2 TaxID=3160862 RepID=UPI0032E481C3